MYTLTSTRYQHNLDYLDLSNMIEISHIFCDSVQYSMCSIVYLSITSSGVKSFVATTYFPRPSASSILELGRS